MFINNRVQKKQEKVLKFNVRSGYYILNLYKNNIKKSAQIHRLVAEAFIPNPNNYPVVNHKDFNRKNNAVENLEWTTQKGNVNWSICNMRHRKSKTHTNTGEKYITFRKTTSKYRVQVDRKEYGSFKTLEEAIKKRDDILNGKK